MYFYKISLNKSVNMRSLSYLENKDKKRIKNNLLIRSDALTKLDANDIAALEALHISKIIDLRTNKEILEEPDLMISNAAYIHNPILEDGKIGITKDKDSKRSFEEFVRILYQAGIDSSMSFMKNTYRAFVTNDFAMNAYRNFILELMNSEGPVLWHCSAGKDRAGFATVLILHLLDFDLDVIMNDYLFTNECYQATIDEQVRFYGDDYREILNCIYTVKKEYLESLFEYVDENYQSFSGFIEKKLKITNQEKEKLKKIFLE